MKYLDIRSESAVKLLSEFLDMDQPYVEGEPHPNAEHFAHGMFPPPLGSLAICSFYHHVEMHSYLRSPFRDLYVYDKMVQVRIHLFVLRFGCVTYTLLWFLRSSDFSN
jgi:E3 ubiquitin-protein ligase Topors